MTKTSTVEAGVSIGCPKCSSSRVRDLRRVPLLMSIWSGCFAAVVFLPVVKQLFPSAGLWLAVVRCLPLMALAGWIFHRAFERRYTHYVCKDCRHRWRDAA